MIRKNVIGLILVLLASSICSPTLAAKFSDFYFVGDSLTDIGNNPDYVNHRQPGGVNWSQFLAGKFGHTITNSDKGGNNYAYVGAESYGTHGAIAQTQQLLADHPQLNNKALYSLWIGANDLRDVLVPVVQPLPVILAAINKCAGNIGAILTQMHNAGARYILVGNMPDLGKTPEGSTKDPLTRMFANWLAQTMNNSIKNAVNGLAFDVIQIDDYGLFNDVSNHHQDFGFIYAGDKMCKGSGDPNCRGYLFWDEIHPSQQGQSLIADYMYSVLVAPNYYAYLAETPFSLVRSNHGNIKNEIWQQNVLGSLDKPYFFMDGNYSPYRSVAHDDNRSNNKAMFGGGTMGMFYPINNSLSVGGAFGYNQDNTKIGGDEFTFKTHASNVELFATFHDSQFYITAGIDGGYLNFSDIDRNIMLGQKKVTAVGNTNGWIYGAAVDSGYQIALPGNVWHTGPILALDYQRVNINGYTESGDAEENYVQIVFENQTNSSFTTALGWEANFKVPVNRNIFSGTFFATGNREWLDGDRNIHFRLVSTSGAHSSLPVGSPKYYFLNGGANFGLTFANIYTVSLGYSGIFGPHKLQQHSINAGLAIAL